MLAFVCFSFQTIKINNNFDLKVMSWERLPHLIDSKSHAVSKSQILNRKRIVNITTRCTYCCIYRLCIRRIQEKESPTRSKNILKTLQYTNTFLNRRLMPASIAVISDTLWHCHVMDERYKKLCGTAKDSTMTYYWRMLDIFVILFSHACISKYVNNLLIIMYASMSWLYVNKRF